MDTVLFNVHDVVLIMTTTLCLAFVVLILWLKKDKDISDYFFLAFVFLQALMPLDILFNFGAAFRDWATQNSPSMFYIFGIAYWLEAPAMLFYIKYKVVKDRSPKYSDLVFFVPAALYLIWISIDFHSLNTDQKIDSLQNFQLLNNSYLTDLRILTREALRVAIGVFCINTILHYKQQAMNVESASENIDLVWLTSIAYSFLTLRVYALLLYMIIFISSHTSLNLYHDGIGLSANYITLALVFVLICAYLINSQKLTGLAENAVKKIRAPNQALRDKLESYIQEHKPYLKNNLSLDQLAERSDISARNISAIINSCYHKNFFEYINDFRLDDAKYMLLQYQDKSITEIFYECGFNSKSTFNTYFKKRMGMTPSQYRKASSN